MIAAALDLLSQPVSIVFTLLALPVGLTFGAGFMALYHHRRNAPNGHKFHVSPTSPCNHPF